MKFLNDIFDKQFYLTQISMKIVKVFLVISVNNYLFLNNSELRTIQIFFWG